MFHSAVMHNYEKWTRVSKRTARKAYDNGQAVAVTPRNMYPFNPWGATCTSLCAGGDGCTPFDDVVNAFEYYNCVNRETGKYAAFYIVKQ